jgi:hypothetical protein
MEDPPEKLLATRSQLKSSLLHGWIDNRRLKINYGFSQEKT